MAQVQFALVPGRVNNEVLDYYSNEGIKLYNKATALLETKYDLDTGHLYLFLQKVRNRAMNQIGHPSARLQCLQPPPSLVKPSPSTIC
jgi:hypothetical protein